MDQHTPLPPECNTANDGTDDIALLRAISKNPDTAHALAAIAEGADPSEILADLLPKKAPEPEPEPTPEPEPEPVEPVAAQPGIPLSSPLFLCGTQTDFWDDFK